MDYREIGWSHYARTPKAIRTVRDYTYLILTSQSSMRGPIVGHEA